MPELTPAEFEQLCDRLFAGPEPSDWSAEQAPVVTSSMRGVRLTDAQFGDALIGAPGIRSALLREFPELFQGLRPGGNGVSIKIFSSDANLGEFIFLN